MKIPMRGALRTRLVLEAPQDLADDIGGTARSFVPVTSVWAAIEPLSAARVWQAQQAEQEISHRVISRENPQADGLAERMVQTVKQSLRRCLLDQS